MKPYLKTLIIFILTYALAVGVRHASQYFITEDYYVDIIFKSVLLVAFRVLTGIFVKENVLNAIHWKPAYWGLLLILIILFAVNNYFQVMYSDSQYYPEMLKSALGIYIVSYIISSTAEEVIYRGFVQQYMNEHTPSNNSKVSKGNLVATALFFVSHAGFFMVMPTVFAITSLVNVLVFSLIAGYLFDRTKNILVPIAIHILINMIHVFIQVMVS